MTDDVMRLPVFVFEGPAVTAFEDLSVLEDELDPESIEEGAYEAWDAAGRRVTLLADGEVIMATLDSEKPADPAALEAKLKTSLKATGRLSLADLEIGLERIVKDFRQAGEGLANLTPVGRVMHELWGRLKPGTGPNKG